MDRAELFGRRRFGVRLGLDALRAVDGRLGQPCEGLPCVSIVGTNGKGSTAAMVAHGLQGRGIRVGLFTSPHLSEVEERVRIDGHMVSAPMLDAALELVQSAERQAGVALTFFEILTLAALCCFRESGVHALVLEAGLGGRLDSTRLRRRDVVLIARIGLDHQQWLGSTLEAIAAEKIAILEPGGHAISQAQTPGVLAVLRQHAAGVGDALELSAATERPPTRLWGEHQRENAGLALAGIAALCRRFPDLAQDPPSLVDIDNVQWPGRFEWLWPPAARGVTRLPGQDAQEAVAPSFAASGAVLVDVAHNPDGVRALTAAVQALTDWRPSILVFGALADKDALGMIEALAPLLAGIELWHVVLEGGAAPRTPAARDDSGVTRQGAQVPSIPAAQEPVPSLGEEPGRASDLIPARAHVLGVARCRTWWLDSEGGEQTPQSALFTEPEARDRAQDRPRGAPEGSTASTSISTQALAVHVIEKAQAGERVLVCGSFHLVGPLRSAVLAPGREHGADPNDPRHAHSLRGSAVAR